IAFELACGKSDEINLVEFIPEYRGTRRNDGRPGRAVEDSVAVREIYREKAMLIPDAVVCLENAATAKRALFFLEVDLGSEKLIAEGRGKYSVMKKMLLYREYLNNRGFERYSDLFRFRFKGFRVLTVMNNAKRTARLRAELRQNGIHKIIWFAQDTEINHTTLLDKIWQVPDAEDNERHSILHG
ncbi:replication-relaxation family protein, partial [bacterium]|nr:replication-relaxation family protein [bacterium]